MFAFSKGAPNEDRLTAALFGLMHYLAAPELLHPFLGLLSAANPAFEWSDGQLPDVTEVVAWPSFEVPEHMGERFTEVEEGTKGTVIPDGLVVLHWRRWGVEARSRRVWVYLEAEHSKTVEAEQLAQQWAVLEGVHEPGDEWWLLLLNRSSTLPWPDSARPRGWGGSREEFAQRDLVAWCDLRRHYLRTGEVSTPSASMRSPLLHLSWQACSDLVRSLERRSWAYSGLLAGLREYLAIAGYSAAVSWLEVVEYGMDDVPLDLFSRIAGHRPEALFCDPDAVFSEVDGAYLPGVKP